MIKKIRILNSKIVKVVSFPYRTLALLNLFWGLGGGSVLKAQTPVIPPPQVPELPTLPETLPSIPTSPLQLPEAEPLLPPSPFSEVTVSIREIEVLGNTVFSNAELDAITDPFLGKEADFADLLAIRTAITNLYIRSGYTTSGAFLPPQDITEGVIQVQVVEGSLEAVEITGLECLEESYVRSRLKKAGQTPVNIQKLEEALQLLQINPLFSRIQADLTAGTAPGQSILILDLEEAEVFDLAYLFNNYESPNVGSIRNGIVLSHQNLLGFGDSFIGEVGLSEGVTKYSLDYAVPINASNTTVNLGLSQGDQVVVEDPFASLDINSNTQTYSVGVKHPLIYTPNEEFSLGLALDLRRSKTFLLDDIPFSFSLGPEDGKSKVTVLRFSQDWIKRRQNRVIAARSQFSLGIDAFDATINETGTDGRFFSWIGQAQLVQSLDSQGKVFVTRLTTQLTPNSLLPLEQFSVGGINSVRGYRQNQRVADNGVVGSVELRIPLYNQPDNWGVFQIIPFFDVGTAWSNTGSVSSPRTLVSTGLGLLWQYKSYLEIGLDWGIPLNSVEESRNSLQDDGLFFSLRFQPF